MGDRHRDAVDADLISAASSLRVPTLLVRGGSSELVQEEHARHFLDLAREAEYVDVAGAPARRDVDAEREAIAAEMLSSEGMTVWAGVALMVFILLYSPCFPTVVAIGKETGSWKWSVFSMTFNTVLGFALAVAVFQAGSRLFH